MLTSNNKTVWPNTIVKMICLILIVEIGVIIYLGVSPLKKSQYDREHNIIFWQFPIPKYYNFRTFMTYPVGETARVIWKATNVRIYVHQEVSPSRDRKIDGVYFMGPFYSFSRSDDVNDTYQQLTGKGKLIGLVGYLLPLYLFALGTTALQRKFIRS